MVEEHPEGKSRTQDELMAKKSDLERLLRGLEPELSPHQWVFATVDQDAPSGLHPFATIDEEEGLTLVLRREEADRLGLPYDYVAARITLRIRSDLAAVGLTAAVSARLAAAGISCNVIAGYHHDHLLVPHDRGAEAVRLLEQLAVESATAE